MRLVLLALVVSMVGCNDSPQTLERRKPKEHLKEKIVELKGVRGDDPSERRHDAQRKAKDWLRQNPDFTIVEDPWFERSDIRTYKMLVRPKHVSSRPMDDD